jgi:hypothetical protein
MTSRVKGPGEGPPPASPVDESREIDGVDSVAPSEVAPVSSPQRGSQSGAPDPIAQVAARLRAGEIGVDKAVELLIDDAIHRQVGRASASGKELEKQLRELLRSYASSDPFLAAKIRRLTLK